MELWINGDKKTSGSRTVEELLQEYGMERKLVVVEIDGAILNRDQWAATELTAGMRIELVHFVGGG